MMSSGGCEMIERKTVLEQPELHRSGLLGVKIAILMVEDGVEIDCKWHRTSIPTDVDPRLQMGAVNAHLTKMGMAPVSQDDIELVVQCHDILRARFGQSLESQIAQPPS